MEVSPHSIPGFHNWPEQFTAALHNQRKRAREFLLSQQERLRKAEAELSAQLQQVATQLAEDQHATRQAQAELQHRSELLQQQSAALEQIKSELAARQTEWETLYGRAMEQQQAFADQLKQQQEELALQRQDVLDQQSAAIAAEGQLQRERKTIEADRAELETQRAQLQTLRDSLRIQQDELDARQQELAARTAETETQRRSIARELKARHAAYLKELQQRQSELEQAAAERRELQQELEPLREQCRILSSNPPSVVAAPPPHDDEEGKENYRLLYETANQELSELKTRNDELQEELTRLSQTNRGSLAQISPSVLNWESEKQRILAALEADFEEENAEDQEVKLQIEEVIRKTDRVAAERDREISELRQLLASQSKHIGSVAVGAAAVGQLLDSDAIIQEERNNLKKLQDEWSEKLRQAEVEISLERAKIARERSQLENKIRTLEQQGVNLNAEVQEKEPAKPPRGRWRSRLGLNDTQEEQGK